MFRLKSLALIFIALLPPLVMVWPESLWAAASSGGDHLDGGAISAAWAVPFVGLLLSIALVPLAAPKFWHHHYGKISAFWAVALLTPFALSISPKVVFYSVLHTILLEYMPFIFLLLALFTITGGIRLTGSLLGRPAVNTAILGLGAVIASLMGTTGAAMLLIRPILRANGHRRYKVHTVVFFVFLVANIGGSLTPLGDPPLFLGFLQGVSFFWTTTNLLPAYLFLVAALLAIYFALDTVLYAREDHSLPDDRGPKEEFGLIGGHNLPFLLGVVVVVLISGIWRTKAGVTVYQDIVLTWPNLFRDLMLLALAAASYKVTSQEIRQGNDFTWEPILEVARLFAGIFITMIPVLAILQAGPEGALRGVVALVTSPEGQPLPSMYFWLTGVLSSFLDNAPTYLVFFNTAGGDAARLMTEHRQVLAAVSCGAVFMGANTYIGNAPNFMVRSIAQDQGVKMPSFFGYMVWSVGILGPLFVLVNLLFIR